QRALERRLAEDPAAAALLEEHRKLDALIRRSAGAVPQVNWRALAESIQSSAQLVSTAPQPGAAVAEQSEFLAAEWAAGTLDPEQREAMEARAASDPALRQTMRDHAALDTLLKNAWPVPHVDYHRLAAHLSDAVAAEEERSVYSIALRIGQVARWA